MVVVVVADVADDDIFEHLRAVVVVRKNVNFIFFAKLSFKKEAM